MNRKEWKRGLKDGIPICLGYFSVSIAFGIMAAQFGIPVWAAVLISVTNVTSAGQFAGLQLMIGMSSYLELMVTTLVINIRYALMSLSMSQKVKADMSLGTRLAISYGITDEIFAVGMQHRGDLTGSYMAGLILTPVLGWTAGTFTGAALTQMLPEIVSSALGIALYGMFIAIIIPPARKNRAVLFTVVAAIVCSLLLSALPMPSWMTGGWKIILITVVVSAAAALLFPIQMEKGEEE